MMAPANMIECKPAHLLYLAHNMREDEQYQFCVMNAMKEYDADVMARWLISKTGPSLTMVDKEGIPMVAGGYEEVFPGVSQSWMAGTNEGWENWRNITRGVRWLMKYMIDNGTRRLQTSCLADREKTIEWYERGLKLKREGTLEGFGMGGEDIALFAYLEMKDETDNQAT